MVNKSIDYLVVGVQEPTNLKEGIDYKHQLITNHCRDEAFSHDVLEAVASGSTLTPA